MKVLQIKQGAKILLVHLKYKIILVQSDREIKNINSRDSKQEKKKLILNKINSVNFITEKEKRCNLKALKLF